MSNQRPQHLIPATLAMSAAAIALLAFSDRIAEPLRSHLRDGLRPGLTALDRSVAGTRHVVGDWAHPADVPTTERDSDERTVRRLRAANARLRERLANAGEIKPSPYRGTPSAPLVLADLVEARVLGKETAEQWRAGWLLNRGTKQGVAESALVLRDDGPLIDVGTDAKLEPGFAVFAGRTVVGRIRAAGRWSATLEPVHAAGFRGHAQLIRKTPAGYAFGATGVIEGTGDGGCRLTMISTAEPVAVGDGVYTVSDGGEFPFPMYYGKVTRAEPVAGAVHWEIDVEPAARTAPLRTVQVLRKRLNPRRAGSDAREAGVER